MRTASVIALALIASGSIVLACGSSNERSGFNPDGTPTGSSGSSSSGSSGGDGFGPGTGGDGGKPVGVCAPDPKNYDVPGNNCDDDGDGKIDNPETCDGTVATNTGEDFAKAIGICTKAADKGYGLVSAKITRGNTETPSPKQYAIVPKFGKAIVPREGKMLGLLSTGYAQDYDGAQGVAFGGEEPQNDFLNPVKQWGQDWKAGGQLPPGFPKAANGCDQSPKVRDVVDVHLEVKAPPNAAGIKFDFNFYSGEWPAYICSQFNDGFIAYLSSPGFNNGKPDNVSFDKDKNPVSVNNGFFDRCTPNVPTGCAPASKPGMSTCPGGTAELEGTGFGIVKTWCAVYSMDPLTGQIKNPGKSSTNGGATGWLTSQAPIKGGDTFAIDFVIWDTGDGFFDSSVLVDNFTYVAGEVSTGTVRPPN